MSLIIIAGILGAVAVCLGLFSAVCAHAMGRFYDVWRKYGALLFVSSIVFALASLFTFIAVKLRTSSEFVDKCEQSCETQRVLDCGYFVRGTSTEERNTRYSVCRAPDGGVDVKIIR